MPETVYSQPIDLDGKLLVDFVYALNIARRQVLSYPSGHPLISAATGRLAEIVPRLLEFRQEISFGVARDVLLVDGVAVETGNPVFSDLARHLFGLRLAVLAISRNVSVGDFCDFFELFRTPPERLLEEGGVLGLIGERGLGGIRIEVIDYAKFSATEVEVLTALHDEKGRPSEAALLWRAFAMGMAMGVIDRNGGSSLPQVDQDPEQLAALLNQAGEGEHNALERSYDEAITAFLRQAAGGHLNDRSHREMLDRLGAMVGGLNPGLRQRFMNSTLRHCAETPDVVRPFLGGLPRPVLVEAFEQLETGSMQVPQTLLELVGLLARQGGHGEVRGRVTGEVQKSVEETARQLTTLFARDNSEYFVPRDYRDALATMTASAGELVSEVCEDDLLASLGSQESDRHFGAILADMLSREPEKEAIAAVGSNLDDLFDAFLDNRDYASLHDLYRQLQRRIESLAGDSFSVAWRLLERFSAPETVGALVAGMDATERESIASLEALVVEVGSSFAGPLLDRLAVEQGMSVRRALMDSLVKIGSGVRESLAARLADERWYFVRNLVVLLRRLDDPGLVPLLGRLAGHPHPKVQAELLKTYLHYGDDRANRVVLKELSGKDPAGLMAAIRLAANSRDPRISVMLARLLNRRLPADQEFAVKSAALKVLKSSAGEEVLPELADFLLGRKLFGSNRSAALKVEAVAVLERIGTIDAGIIAGKVARATSGELAGVAETVLARIHRRFA